MQLIVSQIFLPFVLAFVMLGVGLTLKRSDFIHSLRQPLSVFIGLLLQITLLPLIALVIIAFLPLSTSAQVGLFLVALCPGGATSNLFSLIAKGNVALSIMMTGLMSLLAPFLLPLLLMLFLHSFGDQVIPFKLPLLPTVQQLLMVTALPVIVGMVIAHLAPDWTARQHSKIKTTATLAMIIMIASLLATQPHILPRFFSVEAIAVLLLSTMTLLTAYKVASWLGFSQAIRRTLAIEVGVQNAGTAMMVALVIMQQPALSSVPLLYGLLMNIPAFAFVTWLSWKDRKAHSLKDAQPLTSV